MSINADRNGDIAVALIRASKDLKAANQNRDAAIQKAREAAISGHQVGWTEVELAARLNVNRLTIRRWLGK